MASGRGPCAAGRRGPGCRAPGRDHAKFQKNRSRLPAYGSHSTYGVRVTRTPLALAALASAAVPGLDPATVEGVVQRPGHQFEVAFIHDTQHLSLIHISEP